MTKIAILTATELEMSPIKGALGSRFIYCVTGIGVLNTAIATAALIEREHPDFIIQAGICGAIDKGLQMEQVVNVTYDYVADLGAMRGDVFERFSTEIISNNRAVDGLQSVRGRTVSTACAAWMVDDSQVESMEGAAFMAVCAAANGGAGIEHLQIRAISNYIDTPRADWRIGNALTAITASISTINFK